MVMLVGGHIYGTPEIFQEAKTAVVSVPEKAANSEVMTWSMELLKTLIGQALMRRTKNLHKEFFLRTLVVTKAQYLGTESHNVNTTVTKLVTLQ